MAWMESSNLIIYHDSFTKNDIVIMRIHSEGYDELHLFPLTKQFAHALPTPAGTYFSYEGLELKTQERLHEYDYIELADYIFVNATAIYHFYGDDVPVIQILNTQSLDEDTVESLKQQHGLYGIDISMIKITISGSNQTAFMVHEVQRFMRLAFNLNKNPNLEIVEISDTLV